MSRRQPHQRSTAERGYGREHQKRRLEVKRLVDDGVAKCSRCGDRIAPGSKFHLDHQDHLLAHELGLYRGLSHRWCNSRRATARRRARTPSAGRTSRRYRRAAPRRVSGGDVLRYVSATRAWRAERWSRMNCSTIQFINTNTNPQTIIAFKTLKCINAAEDCKNSRINAIPPRVYSPRHADKRRRNICWQGTDLHVLLMQISRVSEGYPARTHSCWSAPFNQDQIKIIKIKSR